MADEEKKILLSIKLDTGDIIVKQAALAKEIDNTKKSMADIKKSSGEGSVAYQQQKAELQNLQREYKNSNNILQLNQRIASAQKGSYEELLNVTKKMEIKLKLMGQAGDTTSKEFLELTAAVGKNKEALNVFNQGINVGTSNVGRYAESLAVINKTLASTPFGGFIQGIGNIGKAFVLHPIGLIITSIVGALAALKKAFTSTEEGQDKMAKGFEVISSVVGGFFKLLQPLANFLFDKVVGAFESLGNAAAYAGKILSDTLAVFGFDKAAKSVDNFINSTSKAATAGANIAELRNKAEEIERELIVKRAKLEAQIADAKQKAADIDNVSASDRKKAIKEAIKLTNELANAEEERAKLLLQAKILENKTTGASEEDKKQQAELEAALFSIQRNRSQDIAALQKAEKKGNKELQDQEKERFDAAEAQSKREVESIKEAGKVFESELKKRVDAFNKSTKSEADQTKLIEDIESERAKFIKATISETSKQKIALLDIEYKKQLENIENEKFLLQEKGLLTLENEKKLADDKLKIDQTYADNKRAIEQASVQANLDIAQDGLNSLKVIAGDNFEAQKGIALLQVALDEAKAISSLIASSTANPLNSVTFGAAGIAQFAAGILGLAANIARVRQIINSQPPPKAEHGIILGGQPHSRGGTTISADGVPIAEAERGELLTIVNKRSTGMLQGLSNLNVAGGGIPFMKHGGIPEFQSGGIPVLNDQFNNVNMMMNAIKNLPHPVVAVQDIIEAIGKLTEVKNKANI